MMPEKFMMDGQLFLNLMAFIGDSLTIRAKLWLSPCMTLCLILEMALHG
jgi:hypothetical protein